MLSAAPIIASCGVLCAASAASDASAPAPHRQFRHHRSHAFVAASTAISTTSLAAATGALATAAHTFATPTCAFAATTSAFTATSSSLDAGLLLFKLCCRPVHSSCTWIGRQ